MAWPDLYPPERVVPYDPAWPARFAELAAGLTGALGEEWVVEHVGSTSVPGLAAKPVIDVALRIPTGWCAEDAGDPLVAAGWTPPQPYGEHHVTFRLVGGRRHGIGHLFTAEQWPDAEHRLFADWLRAHPEDRDAYAALKRGLVADGVWGKGYTHGKTDFVRNVLSRARAARRLPG